MNKTTFFIVLGVASVQASAASFPHKSAIYTTKTSGPMMESTIESYVYFDGNEETAISAQWMTDVVMGRKTRKLSVSKGGVVKTVDLDTKHCTETNISSFTQSIKDPEKLAKDMKQQMNLQEQGTCEGAGLTGTKYTSSFGELCMYRDVFMLWQNAMGTNIKVTNVKFDVDLPKSKTSIPSDIKCVAGPDLSQGWQGNYGDGTRAPESAPASGDRGSQPPPPQNMEEAMEKTKDVLKEFGFGDMFK